MRDCDDHYPSCRIAEAGGGWCKSKCRASVMGSPIPACPFCGAKEIKIYYGPRTHHGWPSHATCAKCGATGPTEYATKENDCIGAIVAWSARA